EGAWERTAEANKRYLAHYETDYRLYADALAFRGSLFGIARFLVRAGEEADKPAADRLDGFDDYSLRIGRREIVEPFPVYPDFEILQLTDSLTLLVEEKGEEDELVRKILAGKSPRDRATELIRNTKMGDPKVRKALFDGKAKAVEASTDCMIALARLVDPIARRVTEEMSGEISEVMSRERLRISKATQIVRGADSYPDATSTLRLTFGKLAIPQRSDLAKYGFRTLADVFTVAEKPEAQGWYRIPPPWKKQKDKIDLQTPFYLTVHCDVNNGSSGSPAISRAGDLLGVACRIPNEAISLNYQYRDELARVWAVSTPAIVEVLSKVYEASELVQELTGKPAVKSGN
ncbi:MAG TPA: S46 family peptidase, partial [Gemmataceae bacterium]|nr:S46 family peptidase [Gemmataceae bacterium]